MNQPEREREREHEGDGGRGRGGKVTFQWWREEGYNYRFIDS